VSRLICALPCLKSETWGTRALSQLGGKEPLDCGVGSEWNLEFVPSHSSPKEGDEWGIMARDWVRVGCFRLVLSHPSAKERRKNGALTLGVERTKNCIGCGLWTGTCSLRHRLAAIIWAACCSLVSVTVAPLIMRATSRMRERSSSWRMRVLVRPSAEIFSTTRC